MHHTKGGQKIVTAVDNFRMKESELPKNIALKLPNNANYM